MVFSCFLRLKLLLFYLFLILQIDVGLGQVRYAVFKIDDQIYFDYQVHDILAKLKKQSCLWPDSFFTKMIRSHYSKILESDTDFSTVTPLLVPIIISQNRVHSEHKNIESINPVSKPEFISASSRLSQCQVTSLEIEELKDYVHLDDFFVKRFLDGQSKLERDEIMSRLTRNMSFLSKDQIESEIQRQLIDKAINMAYAYMKSLTSLCTVHYFQVELLSKENP